MNYKQQRKYELLNSVDGRSLMVDLEPMLDESYRIMGRDMNEIPIRVWLKACAVLEARGYYK
jgi:hypothetical protein